MLSCTVQQRYPRQVRATRRAQYATLHWSGFLLKSGWIILGNIGKAHCVALRLSYCSIFISDVMWLPDGISKRVDHRFDLTRCAVPIDSVILYTRSVRWYPIPPLHPQPRMNSINSISTFYCGPRLLKAWPSASFCIVCLSVCRCVCVIDTISRNVYGSARSTTQIISSLLSSFLSYFFSSLFSLKCNSI